MTLTLVLHLHSQKKKQLTPLYIVLLVSFELSLLNFNKVNKICPEPLEVQPVTVVLQPITEASRAVT